MSGTESLDDENSFKLNLNRTPLSSSFVLFDTSMELLADPNFAEESICEGQISVTVDEEGQICALSKVGGGSSSQSILRLCVDQAKERSKELRALMQQH